ncbi:hypothetical protein Glove_177g126 [Diversispora epigaea]|uniref:Uncharacterized protein n=1 Tax=Diversispora epigaea TaxID=1348612 RepID=A0A397ING1_9GLOM|nr:hypothetical protein Glove_177g126 [Diversispora epigaea]
MSPILDLVSNIVLRHSAFDEFQGEILSDSELKPLFHYNYHYHYYPCHHRLLQYHFYLDPEMMHPIKASLAGYIQAKSFPYIGSWIQFSLAMISNLCNNSIEQYNPWYRHIRKYFQNGQCLCLIRMKMPKVFPECNQEYNDCKPCNSTRFKNNFDKWTSGNATIDKFIQDA